MRNSALRRPVRRRLVAPAIALALAGSLLAGCGEDSPEADPTDSTPTSSPSLAATSPATATASAKPTAEPTRTPSKPKPTEGTGDGEGDDEPAAAGGGVCVNLSEAEVGALLGGEMTGSAIPDGGCLFSQRNPDLPATTVTDVAFSDMDGGMDGAKTNATSAVEGDPQDLSGVGTAAFVVTGTSFGGTDIQGAGAVRVGDRLIAVNLAQSKGLKRAKVRALVVDLLRLAVAKAG